MLEYDQGRVKGHVKGCIRGHVKGCIRGHVERGHRRESLGRRVRDDPANMGCLGIFGVWGIARDLVGIRGTFVGSRQMGCAVHHRVAGMSQG